MFLDQSIQLIACSGSNEVNVGVGVLAFSIFNDLHTYSTKKV